jgi:hypothetical protein
MTVKFFMRNIERFTERKISDGLAGASEYLASEIRQNISVQGPPASGAGEFPHQDTGHLHGGISADYSPGSREARVVSTAPYTLGVERKRPFMVRTLESNKVRGGIRRRMVGRKSRR